MDKKFILFLCIFSLYAHDHQFQQRYALIKQYLNNYTRPFTALELNGSAENPFSLPISRDYHCTCLLFGRYDYRNCAALCTRMGQDNLLIAMQPNQRYYLKRLAECEHFDVVILPEIHMNNHAFDHDFSLNISLGDHTLIELISYKDLPETMHVKGKELQKLGSVPYSATKKSTLYISYNPRTYLYRRYWTAQPSTTRFYAIDATFEEKSYRKRESRVIPIPWMHGINLMTFSKLQGMYPSRESIVKRVKAFSHVNHGDLAISNIIIQGKKLKLIDWESKKIDSSPAYCVERIIAELYENLGI